MPGTPGMLASINAPCSVNTNGNADLGRLVLDVITNCDEIEVHSSTESRNIDARGPTFTTNAGPLASNS